MPKPDRYEVLEKELREVFERNGFIIEDVWIVTRHKRSIVQFAIKEKKGRRISAVIGNSSNC